MLLLYSDSRWGVLVAFARVDPYLLDFHTIIHLIAESNYSAECLYSTESSDYYRFQWVGNLCAPYLVLIRLLLVLNPTDHRF